MCAPPTKAISTAAGMAAPALTPFFFAAVGPAARTEGATDVLARVWPGLGAAFDFEAAGATDADFVGVTDARVVGNALEVRRGVEEGLLETGG